MSKEQTPIELSINRRGEPINPWSATCPSREIIDLIASKWVLLVLPLLRDGPVRNNDLLRAVGGVSQKVLTHTLRRLQHHALVHREDFHEVPPRVQYSLTPLGQSLAMMLATVDAWVIEHYDEVYKCGIGNGGL